MGGKLRNKIFRSIFWMLVLYIIVSIYITTAILYKNIEEKAEENNKTVALYMKQYLDMYGENHIEDLIVPNDERITLISSEGVVLYDSKADSSEMDNHSQRPEVIDALEHGSGWARRDSDTLDKKYYYYALRLENGNVLRVATVYESIYATFIDIVPVLILVGVLIVIAAWIFSDYQSRRIIAPINEINIDDSEESEVCEEVYDELTPFVTQIHKQSQVIGEQKENLKARKIEFDAVTENMREGLLILGQNGKVLFHNKSAMHLLDIHDMDAIYDNMIVLSRNTELRKLVEQALVGKRIETKITIKGNICHIIMDPVMNHEVCTGVVVLIIDVTQYELNETMRREFSANVSHELKTPLTAISGYAEIIKSGIARQEDIQKFAEIIYAESARMIQLIGDIIRLSKLDEGTIEIEKTQFDVSEVINDILRRLSFSAGERDVELIFEEKTLDSKIYSVRQIVDEMLYNVIENGIKYNCQGGKVWVSLEKGSAGLIVQIKDTGIGIPKKDIGRVFERFYRVDKSHSREIGGTGLGLSIVKHGAAFTGTKVEMDSVEGEGTCVKFTF